MLNYLLFGYVLLSCLQKSHKCTLRTRSSAAWTWTRTGKRKCATSADSCAPSTAPPETLARTESSRCSSVSERGRHLAPPYVNTGESERGWDGLCGEWRCLKSPTIHVKVRMLLVMIHHFPSLSLLLFLYYWACCWLNVWPHLLGTICCTTGLLCLQIVQSRARCTRTLRWSRTTHW